MNLDTEWYAFQEYDVERDHWFPIGGKQGRSGAEHLHARWLVQRDKRKTKPDTRIVHFKVTQEVVGVFK